MKPFVLCLLAALAFFQGSATAVRACQYCRMAADDPEAAKMAAAMHAKDGGFPLDGAINQFQAIAPSATLTAPPPAASVSTSAADLSTGSLPAVATHRLPPPAAAKMVSVAPSPTAAANRWANGGLLGLLGLAGVFGWRTRRTSSPVS